VVLAAGKVIVVASVPAIVMLLLYVRVFPLAMVRVADVAGAVIATLLIDVAVATPSVGVVSVGLVLSTTLLLPVLVVTPVPPLATARVPASVTAPVVAEFGVRPVVPAEKLVTAVVIAGVLKL
jgi:hypothetical protein